MTLNTHPTFDDFYNNNPEYYNSPSDGLINCVKEYNLVPGKALDVGCGQGRNAIWLAKNGYVVDAFDTAGDTISSLHNKACKNNLSINAFAADICRYNFTENTYDLIVVQTTLNHIDHYLLPKICSNLEHALIVGGVIYAVCFTEEDPSCNGNSQDISECSGYVQFYFKKNELVNMFKTLHVLHYDEYVKIDTGHGPQHFHGKAKLIAQKR